MNVFTRISINILPEKSAKLMKLNVFDLWDRLKEAQNESYPREGSAFRTAEDLLSDPPRDGNSITSKGDDWNELHWKSGACRAIVELES